MFQRPCILIAALYIFWISHAPSAHAQQWDFLGVVAQGEQHDAIAGPSGRIHLVSSSYYELDVNGAVVLQEPHGDPTQGPLFFPPAIAVSPAGTVSIVTRDSGDYTNGYNHAFYSRAPNGNWSSGYIYNSPLQRWNFLVGVADDGQGHVHMLSGLPGTDVWAEIQVYEELGGSATYLGSVTDVFRADFDARLRGRGGRVYLSSGNYIPSSMAVFSHGAGGAGLAGQLQANVQFLTAGTGSEKGFPDMAFDGSGTVHFTYGSGHTDHNQFPASTTNCVPGEVHYTQFDANGTKLMANDQTLFTGLGVWHISIGLSAVGVSEDGNTVVAVALRTPDQKEGWDSDLLWAASTDGGQTWSAPQDLGVNTHAGEGRQRPRLVALGSKFFLFYRDATQPGISLATLTFPNPAPPAPSNVTATAVYPSRIDVCWQDNSNDETGFLVERDSGGGFVELATTAPDAICHNDTGLAPGSTHTYRIYAVRDAVRSAPSEDASATTPLYIPEDAQVPVQPDSGTTDASTTPPNDSVSTGCNCQTTRAPTTPLLLLLLLAALLLKLRRRPQ